MNKPEMKPGVLHKAGTRWTVTVCWIGTAWWIAVLALAGAPELSAQTKAAGGISGTVTSEDGKPISGAFVTAVRQDPLYSGNSMTKEDGAFTIDQLPGGEYTLCTQVPFSEWINPCEWTGAGPIVTVVEGQQSRKNEIQLQRGLIVQVLLQDPDKHVEKHNGTPVPAPVVFSVLDAAGLQHGLAPTHRDGSNTFYQITIPPNKDFTLRAFSDALQLADDSGKTVAPNSVKSLPKQDVREKPRKLVVLKVTGTK